MLRDLLRQIVAEECQEPLRDLRDIPVLLARIFDRVAMVLDEQPDFSGDNEPNETEDE